MTENAAEYERRHTVIVTETKTWTYDINLSAASDATQAEEEVLAVHRLDHRFVEPEVKARWLCSQDVPTNGSQT